LSKSKRSSRAKRRRRDR